MEKWQFMEFVKDKDCNKSEYAELIYSNVLELLKTAYDKGYDRNIIEEYVAERRRSISPKTRTTAKRFYQNLKSE